MNFLKSWRASRESFNSDGQGKKLSEGCHQKRHLPLQTALSCHVILPSPSGHAGYGKGFRTLGDHRMLLALRNHGSFMKLWQWFPKWTMDVSMCQQPRRFRRSAKDGARAGRSLVVHRSCTGVEVVESLYESLHLLFLIVPFCFSCVAAIVVISSFNIFTGTNSSRTDIQRF